MFEHLRIAICEDQIDDLDHLTGLIGRNPLFEHARIHKFRSGSALLASFERGMFDLLFMDIFLGDSSGMDAARAVHEADPACRIVFTTNSEEYALESYQVRAAHYLVKPITDQDLSEVWRRCRPQSSAAAACVTMMVGRQPRSIPLADILYAEADNKRCNIYTPREVIAVRMSIDQFERMLPSAQFCRCHRSYIVNFDHVQAIAEDFTMKNGDTVYIRRTGHALVRERYFQSLVQRTRRARTGFHLEDVRAVPEHGGMRHE